MNTEFLIFSILGIVFILGIIGGLIKLKQKNKEDKEIDKIVEDPAQIYEKLTKDGNNFMDGGKKIKIGLKDGNLQITK